MSVHTLEVDLAGSEVVVHQPTRTTVDRVRRAAALGVENDGRPGRRRPHLGGQPTHLDVSRLNPLNLSVACHRDSQLATDGRSPTVAAHELAAAHIECSTVGKRGDSPGTVVVLPDPENLCLTDEGEAIPSHGVLLKDRLDVQLVDAMRRLGRRPPHVDTGVVAHAAGSPGDGDPSEVLADHRGPKRNVVWMFVRQPRGPEIRCHAQATEDLHRAARDVVALDGWWLPESPPVEHDDVDARVRQPHREGETDGSAPDHHDVGLDHVARVASRL